MRRHWQDGSAFMKLDVGCGFPGAAEDYRKRGDIGVDVKRGLADVVADAHHLPFREGVFSKVGIHTSLDHFYDPFQALCEVKRVLCQHGLLPLS